MQVKGRSKCPGWTESLTMQPSPEEQWYMFCFSEWTQRDGYIKCLNHLIIWLNSHAVLHFQIPPAPFQSHCSTAPGLCQDLWAQISLSLNIFSYYVAQIKSSSLICYCNHRCASGFEFPFASEIVECEPEVRSWYLISSLSNGDLSLMISRRWWMSYTKTDKILIFFKLMGGQISPQSRATQVNLTNFPKLDFQDRWIIFISWNAP